MTVLSVLLTLASLAMAAWVHVRGVGVLTAGEQTEQIGGLRTGSPAVRTSPREPGGRA